LLLAATALTPGMVLAETTMATAPADASTAQGGGGKGGGGKAAPTEVGDVVVTAQRRSEAVMSVPISMTVVSGTAVQAAGVVNTRDLEQLAPGLKAGQAGYVFQPALRGITSTDTNPGDESNVALYVDGVYYAAEGGSAFNLVNIKRIEVLKGPQGTLFGRNATGGAIRVITSDPEDSPHAIFNASVGLGGPKSKEISGYVTGPLVKGKLDAGLSLYYYDDDGYMTNVDPNFQGPRQGALNTWNVRGKLRFTPTDNLTITGEADYGHTRSGIELTTTFVDGVPSWTGSTASRTSSAC
jgi:iron complex outermembrane receptor protein